MTKKIQWSKLAVLAGLAILGVLAIRGMRCQDDWGAGLLRRGILHLVDPYYTKPHSLTHTTIKPDTIAVVQYDNPPETVEVSGGLIFPNSDIQLEMRLDDSLFTTMRYNVGGYHGTGRMVVEDGHFMLFYPRAGIDWAGYLGPSIHGMAAGVEHIYINNFLGITHIHPAVPMVEVAIWEDSFAMSEDVYAGIGLTADIAPRSMPSLRAGVGWLWRTSNLEDSRLMLSIGVAFP